MKKFLLIQTIFAACQAQNIDIGNPYKKTDHNPQGHHIHAYFNIDTQKHQMYLNDELLSDAENKNIATNLNKSYMYLFECSDNSGIIGLYPGIISGILDEPNAMYFSVDLPINKRVITSARLITSDGKESIATLTLPKVDTVPSVKIKFNEFINLEFLSKLQSTRSSIYFSFDAGNSWTPNLLQDPAYSKAGAKKLKITKNKIWVNVFFINNLHLYNKKYIFDGQFKEYNFSKDFNFNLINKNTINIEAEANGLPVQLDPKSKNR